MKLIIHSFGDERVPEDADVIRRMLLYKTNPKGICACCGCKLKRLDSRDDSGEFPTIEHMVPAWKVGRNWLDIDNACLLCGTCNKCKAGWYGPDIVAYYYPYLTWQA